MIAPGEEGDHGPYDVVLELVGATSVQSVLPHMAPWSRIVVIGVGGGGNVRARPDAAHGTQDPYRRVDPARPQPAREGRRRGQAVAAHVLPALAAGRLQVPVCDTFALPEVDAAYERFAAGAKLGKVVLVNG